MLCEEKGRLLDAYVTATDRQAGAVKALSAVAAKDNRAAFREALAHTERARHDAEETRLALHRSIGYPLFSRRTHLSPPIL